MRQRTRHQGFWGYKGVYDLGKKRSGEIGDDPLLGKRGKKLYVENGQFCVDVYEKNRRNR